jgi:hypothetical protein
MSLQLKRRPDRPNWYMHGTVRGITVRESTGVADAKAAEAIRARREWEIIQRSVFGPETTTTFVGAAVSYLEAGGERTHLKRIIARIGSLPLAKIDQSVIEQTARALFPNGSPATLNRCAYTPTRSAPCGDHDLGEPSRARRRWANGTDRVIHKRDEAPRVMYWTADPVPSNETGSRIEQDHEQPTSRSSSPAAQRMRRYRNPCGTSQDPGSPGTKHSSPTS